jgi:hypothetical protein
VADRFLHHSPMMISGPHLSDVAVLLSIIFGLNILECMIVVVTKCPSLIITIQNNTTTVAKNHIVDMGPIFLILDTK